MRGDEARLRMLAEHVVALGHQLLERHLARLVVAPIGEQRQLEPALVLDVLRLEELLRLGGVNERRHVEPRERVPQRIDLGIVDLQARAIRLGDAQAELLADFADAERAGLDVGVELLNRLVAPSPDRRCGSRCRRARGSDPCAARR